MVSSSYFGISPNNKRPFSLLQIETLQRENGSLKKQAQKLREQFQQQKVMPPPPRSHSMRSNVKLWVKFLEASGKCGLDIHLLFSLHLFMKERSGLWLTLSWETAVILAEYCLTRVSRGVDVAYFAFTGCQKRVEFIDRMTEKGILLDFHQASSFCGPFQTQRINTHLGPPKCIRVG